MVAVEPAAQSIVVLLLFWAGGLHLFVIQITLGLKSGSESHQLQLWREFRPCPEGCDGRAAETVCAVHAGSVLWDQSKGLSTTYCALSEGSIALEAWWTRTAESGPMLMDALLQGLVNTSKGN